MSAICCRHHKINCH